MPALCTPSISRAYYTRVATRNLVGTRRRRRPSTLLSDDNTLSHALPWRRYLTSSSSHIALFHHASYDNARNTIPIIQNVHYFSSVSTITNEDGIGNKIDDGDADGDADDDDDDDDDDDGGGEVDALTAAIARLKNSDSKHVASDDLDPQQRADVLNSSPFEPSSSSSSASSFPSSTLSSSPSQSLNVFDSSTPSNVNEGATATTPKPNLSDLLQTDIFAESWSEPDDDHRGAGIGGGRQRQRRRGGGGGFTTTTMSPYSDDDVGGRNRSDDGEGYYYGDTKSGYDYNNSNSMMMMSDEGRRNFRGRSSSRPSYDGDGAAEEHSRRGHYSKTTTSSSSSWPSSYWDSTTFENNTTPQPEKIWSPAEMEYNKILERTDELLELLLSKNDNGVGGSSSTLQLTDFDKVMTRWSQFHSEVDGIKNDGGNTAIGTDPYGGGGGGYGGYGNENNNNQTLKQEASEQCIRLLEALEHNYDCILHHHPTRRTTTTVSGMMTSSGGKEDLPKTKHTKLMPNAASYNLTLHALAHSTKGQHVAREATSILMRMLDRCQSYLDMLEEGKEAASSSSSMTALPPPPPPFEPTIITYNSVVHAIAKSGARDAGHLAEEVYARMDRWRDACGSSEGGEGMGNYAGVLPNARTLACVIDAWASAKTTQQQSFAAERVEAILDLAIRRRRDYVDSVMGRVREEEDCFEEDEDDKRVLFVDDDGGVEEEDIVDEDLSPEEIMPLRSPSPMAEEAASPLPQNEMPAIPSLRPNTVAFNSVIHTWASSGRGREGALRAEELLNQLEALSESGELDLPAGHAQEIINKDDISDDMDSSQLKPNVRTYSMVMNAWANVSKLESGSGADAASHCENILNKMEERGAVDAAVRPNLVAYVTAITAWARAATAHGVDHAASRAEHILNRMVDLYYTTDEDGDGTTATSNDPSSLSSLEGDGLENRASHDAPFNSVITAYARSNDPYAAERAFAVLQRLEETSPGVEPTVTSYNAAMDCCAKHGEPGRALEVFDRMKGKNITPDSTSYDTVLNAFARDNKPGSAERAWDFLCQLEEERISGESNFVPSSVSYATIINAFAQASGRENGGLSTVKKAQEIYEKLIDQMKEGIIYGRADPFANSCFLNCCANMRGTGSERKEALVIAITAFEEMKKRPDIIGEPNQYTFGTMMKVCARLSSNADEKNRLMESLFVQACKRGMLSKAVLGQFLRHTPSQLNMRVILSLGGTKREIPDTWYRNVPQKHWPAPMTNNYGGRY